MGEIFAGRFELLDPIAEGGMGSVWRVLDQRDGQVYAGKLLRQSDSASLLRFIREQATRVEHPHVVTPVSWAGEDDRVLFTMPLVRGGSVADLLTRHGPLPARWVREALDQTLQALEAVHSAGLVHRDLKPANLLLEPTASGAPDVRLTDFGVAVPLDEPRMTRASMIVGSPGYMAPEQHAGADPDPRQDLYSAALCGLEMVTGDRPPECLTTARRLADQSPPLTPLITVLLRAASADPESRPASAAALRGQLEALPVPGSVKTSWPVIPDRLGSTGPTAVRPRSAPPPPPTAPTGADPHRTGAWLLIALAVGCLVLAAWLVLA